MLGLSAGCAGATLGEVGLYEIPEPLTGKKDFSGKFVLRVEPGLHKRLAAKALASGDSLNTFCKKALVKA